MSQDQGATAGLALIGGLLGGIGSYFSAREQKKAFRRFRKRQGLAIDSAREFTDERIEELTGEGSLLRLGEDFLRGTFASGGGPLAENLRKGIRVAQESRGLRRSAASASSEARALGAFSQRLRAQLLPEVARFGTLKENLRQSILGFELPIRIGRATGLNVSGLGVAPGLQAGFAGGGSTSAILGGAAAGFLGGANLGQGFSANLAAQQQNAELLDIVRNRRGGRRQRGTGLLDLSTSEHIRQSTSILDLFDREQALFN